MISTKGLKNDLMKLLKGDTKDVALVLSSGGARGLAHVGAIQALTAKGYHITSIAGTSFGSIVGAMYASGHLDDFCDFMDTIDRKRIFQLSDFSLGIDHLMRGVKIIKEMQRFLPDLNIEDLPIPYCAIATDWKTGREVVFDHGSLWTAIRASISVPIYMKPVIHDDMILIDGGITNPLPLDRVVRGKHDLLVGVNVSGHDYAGMFSRKMLADKKITSNSRALALLRWFLPREADLGLNFYSLINQTISIAINANAHRAVKLCPPDIFVDIPMKRYSGTDYDKFEAIRKIGFNKTNRAIEVYEKKEGRRLLRGK
jgi:NTE family protein